MQMIASDLRVNQSEYAINQVRIFQETNDHLSLLAQQVGKINPFLELLSTIFQPLGLAAQYTKYIAGGLMICLILGLAKGEIAYHGLG